MRSYESSTTIAADVQGVWNLLSDVANWPDWLPTVTKVESLDGAALVPGSRFVVRQPRIGPATWRVTEVDAPRRFVWESRSPGLRMVADHCVTAQSPGSSIVVLRFSFDGPLGKLVGRLFRKVTESYLAQEAAALKKGAELSSHRRP